MNNVNDTPSATTPRTDACIQQQKVSVGYLYPKVVDLARTLETELAALTDRATELEAQLLSSQLQCRDALERFECAQATIERQARELAERDGAAEAQHSIIVYLEARLERLRGALASAAKELRFCGSEIRAIAAEQALADTQGEG